MIVKGIPFFSTANTTCCHSLVMCISVTSPRAVFLDFLNMQGLWRYSRAESGLGVFLTLSPTR